MVPILYQQAQGNSPYVGSLVPVQGNAGKQQKPDLLFYYPGLTNDVPTLVCPGHLRLPPYIGSLAPFEIPFFDIVKAVTVVGSATSTKKKVRARCNIEDCVSNETFGVYIRRMPDSRFAVPSEKRYFQMEEDITDESCKTDCTERATIIANMINADSQSIVTATVETTTSGATTYYWLVLEDKTNDADFRADFEGFGNVAIDVNYSVPNYLLGNLRQAYGPSLGAGKPDSTVMTATEITVRHLAVIGNSGGSSSDASYDPNFEVQLKLYVVLTDAAVSNSAAAKTELDAILNGTKTTALYLDKLC
jgi:hypothetical protein